MKDIFEIAGLLIGVATVALLIGNAQQTATVINAGTQGFNTLLRTVTLQNGFGNVSNLRF